MVSFRTSNGRGSLPHRQPVGHGMNAVELATAFRNDQLRLITEAILCDDPRAIELAVPLTPTELVRLAETAIFQYINGFYNPRRRHSALRGKCPLAFER